MPLSPSLWLRVVLSALSVFILIGVLWTLIRFVHASSASASSASASSASASSASASSASVVVDPTRYFRVDSDAPNFNRSLNGLPKGFIDAFSAFGFSEGSTFAQSKWIILRSLDRVDQTIETLPLHVDQAIHGIKGSDWMACKARMYKVMEQYFHENQMQHLQDAYLPPTYVLDRPTDLQQLTTRHTRALEQGQPNPVYILKQNVQRQQGHLVTQDINVIHAIAKDTISGTSGSSGEPPYMVVQEMLQDPFIIRGRKINLRVYLLIVIRPRAEESPEFYICNNGFLYYTPKPFVPYSTDKDEVITTGYIDRRIYEENPLSHHDLEAYLGPMDYATLTRHMMALFGHVKGAFESILRKENSTIQGTKFLVYGCDVAPSRNLETVRLMEINKGPDLSYKDERDKHIKLTMITDMIQIVNGTSSKNASFVRLNGH